MGTLKVSVAVQTQILNEWTAQGVDSPFVQQTLLNSSAWGEGSGVDTANIYIKNIIAGSIIVELQYLAPPTIPASQRTSFLENGVKAVEDKIATAVQSYRGGTIEVISTTSATSGNTTKAAGSDDSGVIVGAVLGSL